MPVDIRRENPLHPDLDLLHARHTRAMHADSPPESIHMLPASALNAPGIAFFVLRDVGVPLGMGAYKRIDASHAEIKSMHVLDEARGRGLARLLLDHLMAAARAEGFARLSLETGAQPSFQAACNLYAAAGFVVCGPFEGYWDDPNSIFMTRLL